MARSVLTKKWVELEGVDVMVKKITGLIALGEMKSDGFKKTFVSAALIVRDAARRNAPVKTGRLRDAIFAGGGDPKKPNALVGVRYRDGAGGKGAPHAHLIEYGHAGSRSVKSGQFAGLSLGYRVSAHPYLRPAITSSRGAVAKRIADGMRHQIEEFLQR